MASKARNKKGPRGGRPRPTGGRVTPKGGVRPERHQRAADTDDDVATDWAAETARYTASASTGAGSSPTWWPVLMFGLMGLGMLLIIANYAGLLPGTPNNWMLLPAVAFIGGGLFAAMSYR